MRTTIAITLLLTTASAGFTQGKNSTFTGEIMDKQCAQMTSHDGMMKSEGAGSAKDCTLKCVKDGGTFVLLDSATKKVYPLEDNKNVREYAGQRVQISGTYDDGADLLHIKTITPAK